MKNNIRVERARLKISQQQLGDLTNVSRQTINAIELGKFIPSTLLSLKISRIFNLTVNEIFELENND